MNIVSPRTYLQPRLLIMIHIWIYMHHEFPAQHEISIYHVPEISGSCFCIECENCRFTDAMTEPQLNYTIYLPLNHNLSMEF